MLNATAPCALVAEDDVLIRLEACEILKEAGFRCYGAATAEKALDILREHGRDIRLLFSDVHMPPGSLTGFDLARQCAQDWPHIRILIASGAATPAPGDMPPGAEFITKPFTATVIHDHLRKVLPNVERPEPLQDPEPGLRRSLNKE
jgi:DNA-binding NtrC family response regulator